MHLMIDVVSTVMCSAGMFLLFITPSDPYQLSQFFPNVDVFMSKKCLDT